MRGVIDPTLYQYLSKKHLMLLQVYVDGFIFDSTNKVMEDEFSKLMTSKFHVCMKRLVNFFPVLEIKQVPQGILIH